MLMKKPLLDSACVQKFEKACKYELLHAQTYRHLASQMQGIGYFGAQKFFLAEIPEEQSHFEKHIDFLNDMGVTISIPQVPSMTEKVKSLKQALDIAYETELDLLEYYREMAKEEGQEYAEILQHLMFYVEVQRKTVGEYGDLLTRLELVADDSCGILLIDQEMGK
jgi:ferritin